MDSPTVLITDGFEKGSERYEVVKEVVETHGGELVFGDFDTEREVIEGCTDADVLLTSKAPITRAVIEAVEDPKYVFRRADACDTINVKAATDHGVPVLHVPGHYLSDVVSEHAIGLMLGAAREMAYCDREMRADNGWGLGKGRLLKSMHDGTFGVVGLGDIGRASADRAEGLGMDVIAYDPYLSSDIFERLGVEEVGFEELLERSDCVCVHAPLTAETHQMFSTEEFDRMKDDAVFVNTARGPIVDMEALVSAVENGGLFAAGVDNYEVEPPVDSPALSWDRILCSPHHASSARETGEALTRAVRAELERILSGQRPEHVLNPEVFTRGDGLVNPEKEAWEVTTE